MVTLSQQIEADLRAHAGAGEAPPYRLTLQAMAERFDVSIQPVRTAVESLLEQQVLLRDPNGRLTFNRRKIIKPSPVPAMDPGQKTPDIDALLTPRIIDLSLSGEALFLREEETANEFGVGRSVLRAAFHRMAGAGLIDHVPRRGWRVRAFSRQQMHDYLEVRETLELQALDLARDRLDVNHLSKLVLKNTPTAGGQPRIDNQLHVYWVTCAHNSYITDFFAQHGKYYLALFDYAALAGHVIEEMAAQHRVILEALIDGQWAAARRELRDHIRSQRPNVMRMLEQAAGGAKLKQQFNDLELPNMRMK